MFALQIFPTTPSIRAPVRTMKKRCSIRVMMPIVVMFVGTKLYEMVTTEFPAKAGRTMGVQEVAEVNAAFGPDVDRRDTEDVVIAKAGRLLVLSLIHISEPTRPY